MPNFSSRYRIVRFSFAFLFIAQSLYAASILAPSSFCLSQLRSIARNANFDSAVELELEVTEPVMNWLTTTDGTVKPVLQGLSVQSLEKSLQDVLQQGADTPWDRLSSDTQKAVINAVAQLRQHNFWQDRKIPGLVIKPVVSLNLSHEMRLFGKDYPTGIASIPLAKYMEPYVEFQRDADIKNLKRIELKVRAPFSAAELSASARVLQKAGHVRSYWRFQPYLAQHVYILAPLKSDPIQDPYLYAAIQGEFFRRANLLAEMHTFLEDGVPLKRIATTDPFDSTKETVFFDSASQQMIAQVGQYFVEVAEGKKTNLGTVAKMAYVGFRGSDYFDQPGLYGLEFRAVNSLDHSRYEVILDHLQKAMVNEDYGLKQDTVKKWLYSLPDPKQVGGALMGIWYNQPAQVLIDNAHPKVRELLNAKGMDAVTLEKYIKENGQQIKMALFNWGYDPMVAESPGLFNKILQSQLDTIQTMSVEHLQNSNYSYDTDIKRFLNQSGLYARVLDSFKIPHSEY